jgi:hypothetical protein
MIRRNVSAFTGAAIQQGVGTANGRFVSPLIAAVLFLAPGSARADLGRRANTDGGLLGIGAGCQSSDDCASALCLAGFADEPVCTRACGSGAPPCPALWSCEVASSLRVCAPQSLEASGGCSIALGERSRAWPLAAWLFLITSALRRNATGRLSLAEPSRIPKVAVRAIKKRK